MAQLAYGQALHLLRCALADLEGVMPEFEPSGDRLHPGWQTIEEIKAALRCKWCSRDLTAGGLCPAGCDRKHGYDAEMPTEGKCQVCADVGQGGFVCSACQGDIAHAQDRLEELEQAAYNIALANGTCVVP